MSRKAELKSLRADLDYLHRDMWDLSEELAKIKEDRDNLEVLLNRADETIMMLWEMIAVSTKDTIE